MLSGTHESHSPVASAQKLRLRELTRDPPASCRARIAWWKVGHHDIKVTSEYDDILVCQRQARLELGDLYRCSSAAAIGIIVKLSTVSIVDKAVTDVVRFSACAYPKCTRSKRSTDPRLCEARIFDAAPDQ